MAQMEGLMLNNILKHFYSKYYFLVPTLLLIFLTYKPINPAVPLWDSVLFSCKNESASIYVIKDTYSYFSIVQGGKNVK